MSDYKQLCVGYAGHSSIGNIIIYKRIILYRYLLVFTIYTKKAKMKEINLIVRKRKSKVKRRISAQNAKHKFTVATCCWRCR